MVALYATCEVCAFLYHMNSRFIYLDNNSTTQCAPEVVEAIVPFFREKFGNPASPHYYGRTAGKSIALARELIADCVCCSPTEVIFTSGATESNNLSILGVAQSVLKKRKIVTSTVEHKSVLGPCAALQSKGYTICRVPVENGGQINLNKLKAEVDEDTLLLSVQAANNETGVIQPVGDIADVAHSCGALFHCDAAQALGKIPVSVNEFRADLLSFSSHKAYGPKGIGFLVVRESLKKFLSAPLMYGGGQEDYLRPGTLNVPGVVGLGAACKLCKEFTVPDMAKIGKLRAKIEERIARIFPNAQIICRLADRLPGTSNIIFPGIPADLLLARAPLLCMSIGSACNSGTLLPSHVLLALNIPSDLARCAIRISLGRYNTEDDVNIALSHLESAIKQIQ